MIQVLIYVNTFCEVNQLKNKYDNTEAKELFEKVYNQYRADIYKFCLVRLKGNVHYAEDCLQNTFLVLYKKYLENESIKQPRAFLYRTADNYVKKCYSEFQKQMSKTVDFDSAENSLFDEQYVIDSNVDYDIISKRIYKVLNADEMMLFTVKYIEDNTIEETAVRLGITKVCAAKRLQRLREKLKPILKENLVKGE